MLTITTGAWGGDEEMSPLLLGDIGWITHMYFGFELLKACFDWLDER